MAALTLPAARPLPTRAAVILLATLHAHAVLLERVLQMLAAAGTATRTEAAAVVARILAPAAQEAPPAPAAATRPAAPKAVPAPRVPRQPADVAPAALSGPGQTAADPTRADEAPGLAPAVGQDTPAASAADGVGTPPAEARSAGPPAEPGAASGELEFEATGDALRTVLAALPSPQTALPAAARYVYRTTYSELRLAGGTTTVDWSVADDGRYRLRLGTTTIGMTVLELESRGSLREFGLAPERYTETRARRGAVAANLDWEGRRVTFSARSHERPLADGVQDRLSFQFQLMLLGQAAPERFRPGARTVMWVAGRDDVAAYRFRSAGTDRTSTGIGERDTVRLERLVERGSEARVDVWLAPDLDWLPVRLRFTDRHGRVTESVLESVAAP